MALAATREAGHLKRARRPRRVRADARHARDVSFLEAAVFFHLRWRALLVAIAIAVALSVVMAAMGRGPRVEASSGVWRAAYYANMDLAGAPALERDEGDAIDEWYDGVTRPAPGVPARGFSVRWTRTAAFDAVWLYRFSVNADDGIRVLIDGQRIIDEWSDKSPTSYAAEMRIEAGEHELAVEYYHHYGTGQTQLAVELISADTPTPTATATDTPVPTSTAAPAPPTTKPTQSPVATEVPLSHEHAPSRTATRTATPTRTATATPTSGSLQPPRIECKWELPDMDSGEHGVQYLPHGESAAIDAAASDIGGTHTYDDDMATRPKRGDHDHHDDDDDGHDGGHGDDDDHEPCDISDRDEPDQPDGVHHAIQVVPNPGDEPEARLVELWLAATHPDGAAAIGGAFWVVYRPDGSVLFSVPGELVRSGDCDGAGHGDGPGSMFDAAANTGQLSRRAIDDDREGLHGSCHFGRTAVYRGEFRLSVNEPCGEYRVTAVAVSTGGAATQLTNYIDVLCVFALKIDFRSVDWGEITPGVRGVVAGDTQFRPRDGAPTVKNVGNDGMGLRIRFTPLWSASGFRVDQFDSCFGRFDDELQCIDPIASGGAASFDREPARVLCGGEPARLDLGLHPGVGLAPGAYRGILSLVGFHVGGECVGDHHLP